MPSSEDVTARAGSLRAMTGWTDQEFQALLPAFEQALVAYMQAHTLDGQPRTVRRYRTSATCPLPTIADKLLCLLTSLQQHPIQAVQGQLFGVSPSHAHTWLHLLHPVLNQAWAHQELWPARTAAACAAMFATPSTDGESPTLLVGMMVRSDRAIAPPIPRTSRNSTAQADVPHDQQPPGHRWDLSDVFLESHVWREGQC